MKGILHCQPVEKDIIEPDGTVRRYIFDSQILPQQVPEEIPGYQHLRLQFPYTSVERATAPKEFLVECATRKIITIKGIPFYASSGTSGDFSVISPSWRKEVWMPFMGFQIQGKKAGRIAKLGDNVSEEFDTFVTKLIDDWAADIPDESLKGLYTQGNREGYGRKETVTDLKEQIKRYGSIETLAMSMQLVPESVWQPPGDKEGNFVALRSLRDYFLSRHQQYCVLSEDEIAEVHSASFEEQWVVPHRVGVVKDHIGFIESREESATSMSSFCYDLNQRLLAMGADLKEIVRLNQPDASTPNTLVDKLASLIFNLNSAEKKVWEDAVSKLIDLYPLEYKKEDEDQKKSLQELDIDSLFSIAKGLKKEFNADHARSLIQLSLEKADTRSVLKDKSLIEPLTAALLENYYLYHLKKLSVECQSRLAKNSPAIPVIKKLIECLEDKSLPPKMKTENFFKILSENDSQNLNILKSDKSRSIARFLAGIALIAAIVCTGIIPGLLVTAAVYAAKGVTPLTLFQSRGEELAEKLEQERPEPPTP